ncbi:dihydrolipoamide acetyltransferase family protein [Streptomyces sp. NPDC005799]|uniref:dihydrolipoamide acetyltransferase family protein n=1 Tax=Streptomyces sp. NPDC005799 TaxID=3154678 RepID=UPI00340BF713
MAHVVRMPSVMANATEAIVAQWLVSVGAHVKVGDPIAEIETEKALVEYAAEVGGTVGRLLAEPGASVAVGTPIAIVLEEGEDAASVTLDDPRPDPTPTEPASATPAVTASAAPAATAPHPGGRLFTTPIVRKLAAERGIDLSLVRGSGPHGRIVRRDLDAYTTTLEAATAATPPAPVRDQATDLAMGYTDVPLSGMRRAIARRLTESKTTVPHFYVTAHVRVDRLLELRQEANALASRKISVNDVVVKAVGTALVDVPAANAIWNADAIRRFDGVDVAVAVAVPDGLLTPVVRGVQALTVTELSARLADLADRARTGRLRQHELEGGSFSVSNLGMYGVDEFSAILNPPQAGILAVAAAKRQPVVEEDGRLGVGSVMTVTLSADHRVIDGAVAAEWMAALVRRLENPLSLLL